MSKMNKILSVFIVLSLCGCAAKAKKVSRGEVTAIISDRRDVIIVPQAPYNEKFRVMPVEYRALIACNSINLKEPRARDRESFVSKSTPNSHEKWLSKMRAHATEMESQVNGAMKSGGFNIKSIPIGISYKMELDKPRKKAKNGNGGG